MRRYLLGCSRFILQKAYFFHFLVIRKTNLSKSSRFFSDASCRLVDTFSRRREAGQLTRRAAWAGKQFATAIGTSSAKKCCCTSCAERALERTDSRLGRVWWKVLVAALTSWAKLKHGILLKKELRNWSEELGSDLQRVRPPEGPPDHCVSMRALSIK